MKTKQKVKIFSKKRFRAFILLVATLAVAAGAYTIFGVLLPPPQDKVIVQQGRVTDRQTSCHMHDLPFDTARSIASGTSGPLACFEDDFLVIDGIYIVTRERAALNDGGYYSLTHNIDIGDSVEVAYVHKRDDKGEYKSTDCAECYVKREGLPKERQEYVPSRISRADPPVPLQQSFKRPDRYSDADTKRQQDTAVVIASIVLLVMFVVTLAYLRAMRRKKSGPRSTLFRIPLTKQHSIKVLDSGKLGLVLMVGLILALLAIISTLTSPKNSLNAIITCVGLPAELVNKGSAGGYYRLPGDPGYGLFNQDSTYQCTNEIINGTLRNYPRDPSTAVGKQQQVEQMLKLEEEQRQEREEKKRDAAEQKRLISELEYTIYVPSGYDIEKLRLTDYRGKEGFDSYGIMTKFVIRHKKDGTRFDVIQMQVTPDNDSLCATKGERYSGCRVIGKDIKGREIERNFKPLGPSFSTGTRIGNTNIELNSAGANPLLHEELEKKAIKAFGLMKPYRA